MTLLQGCDLGAPAPLESGGPDVHLLATYPASGDGADCSPDGPEDCGVPLDVAIELRFDRFLLPKTAVRQSIVLYTGPRNQGIRLQPFYDVVERVVLFRVASGAILSPGLLYHVEIVSPGDDPNAFGFRAFDGAPLAKENPVPLKFTFVTARATPPSTAPAEPPTCYDAWTAFSQSGCASALCHAGPDAPMGLHLDSGVGLRDTAVGHVAHETDDGPVAGRPLVDPGRFGTAMPVIDPGNPGTSYLLYKLLVQPGNFGPRCGTKYQVPLEGSCAAPSAAETQRLRDRVVQLDPMPVGGSLVGGKETLDVLQDYILAGAETDSCP